MTGTQRETVKEVLSATRKHFQMVCDEDNSRLQDAVDGMDISISKLERLLKEQGDKDSLDRLDTTALLRKADEFESLALEAKDKPLLLGYRLGMAAVFKTLAQERCSHRKTHAKTDHSGELTSVVCDACEAVLEAG